MNDTEKHNQGKFVELRWTGILLFLVETDYYYNVKNGSNIFF